MRAHQTQLLIVLSLAVVALLGSTVRAAESTSDGWSFEVAPLYLWAMGLDGEIAVKGQYTPVDIGFDDILDDLDFAGTVHFEGRNADWGFLLDATFVALESEDDLPPIGAFPGGAFVAETDITVVEAMGYHRFPSSGKNVDLLFGARYMDVDNDLTPPTPLPTVGGSADWTDGLVGARLWTELSTKWSLILRGDLSAGGSDLTWSASSLFHRQFKRRAGLVVGYRVMDVDYEDGSGSSLFAFDAQIACPLFGFKLHWD
jgi:hypothetical protein